MVARSRQRAYLILQTLAGSYGSDRGAIGSGCPRFFGEELRISRVVFRCEISMSPGLCLWPIDPECRASAGIRGWHAESGEGPMCRIRRPGSGWGGPKGGPGIFSGRRHRPVVKLANVCRMRTNNSQITSRTCNLIMLSRNAQLIYVRASRPLEWAPNCRLHDGLAPAAR